MAELVLLPEKQDTRSAMSSSRTVATPPVSQAPLDLLVGPSLPRLLALLNSSAFRPSAHIGYPIRAPRFGLKGAVLVGSAVALKGGDRVSVL